MHPESGEYLEFSAGEIDGRTVDDRWSAWWTDGPVSKLYLENIKIVGAQEYLQFEKTYFESILQYFQRFKLTVMEKSGEI